MNDRNGIDAVAQPGWSGAIGEHMTEVAIALGADHFRADHAVGDIAVFFHRIGVNHVVEAGPAGARIKLRARIKQCRATARAMELSVAFEIIVDAAPRTLGAFVAQDMELLGG